MDYFNKIALELKLKANQVKAVSDLLDDSATIPFIARYRKEAHGSLDEVQIIAIRDRLEQLKELDSRKQAILKSLSERELLTPELSTKIEASTVLSELEDIYLPFRPKKRTKAMIAREKGLEPLALELLAQEQKTNPDELALSYIDAEKGVENIVDALSGARDIIAELINENAEARTKMRLLFAEKAQISSKVGKGQEEAGEKFKDYFAWEENASKTAGHRLLAMLRGEKEGFLSLHILPEAEQALTLLTTLFIKNNSLSAKQVEIAIEDSYKRLLAPAMETELCNSLREKAELEAINVFVQNLRELLLAAPLGQKRVLAVDPGFRTGCKLACLDAQGALLEHDVIYILSENQLKEAALKIKKLCTVHKIEAIAIGNGTASRESETLARSLKLDIPIIMVSESGASVYSASELARKEFPDLDLTVRGAISIGRRLMDPLAELVKIDPKAIGVGQYQHDVDQTALKKSLTDLVESCVNAVGVELNTASSELLSHVSGLGASLASNIIKYREQNGVFKRRKDLLKVPRLGPKAFEQAAGFLRIHNADNPLDASAVHPESYSVVENMAKDLSCTLQDLIHKTELRKQIKAEAYVNEQVGLPTINDILKELEKPGRDPRKSFELFSFNDNLNSMEDLEIGMKVPGIVTNVTNFGAFVDIGVHQDGLVHISQLSDNFVKDPHSVVKVQQKVMVTVVELDIKRKRIALSMKSEPFAEPREAKTSGQSQQKPAHTNNAQNKKNAQPPKNQNTGFNNPFAKLL
ncbi:Tex family protein [Desulfovibrio litoralis]|nr:Tex family protein [Desulfovibrio litoralis]